MKYPYFFLLFILTQCFQVQSQVYINVCVTQTAPLLLSQGTIINESCLNSLNGSATVNATGGKTPYTFSWNTSPSQSTQTATGLAAGIYIATVIDANGCRDTISFLITKNPDPIAAFSNTTECNTHATQFTDNSISSVGTINAWSWDFGDGSSLNGSQNPSYTYVNSGNYNVTLIVNNSFGCADTITKSVQVYFNPATGFSFSNICFGDTLHFTDTTFIDNTTSIANYLWAFGDASPTSNLQNPDHYYPTEGTFTVTLVSTTTDGCSNVAIIPVNVFDAPNSAFSFSNACLLNSVVFVNTSMAPTIGSIANWSWNFGDGSALNTSASSPQHLYTSTGNYTVTLINYSSNLSCSDTLQNTITVFDKPKAKFGFTDICFNEPMYFIDSSTISNGNIASWSWNFGDGTLLSSLQDPSHTYANPGTYIVTLILATNNGCSDTTVKSVVVHPLPVAQFSTINVCNAITSSFTDLSFIPVTDTIQSWKWNFDDGSPLNSNQSPTHLYATIGSYSVQLLVVSNFGCKDSITKTSIVHPNPIVNFTVDKKVGCEPLCISFNDSSFIATGTNAQWLWTFGDSGPTSVIQNVFHCYSNDSIFSLINRTVTLAVTSDSGCVTTKSENNYITVYPNPIANFSVQPSTASIIHPLVSLTELSTGANLWHWNFGDLDTSSIKDPLFHTYADTGTYVITLITSTLYNCSDTAYQTIIIEPDFLFYIPNAFTPNDDGVNDDFSGKGIFIKEYEMMIFDRWGKLIYKTIDINQPWDGKANKSGSIAQADVYVYVINVTDFKKEKHNFKGLVTLVK
ncbi:MAG: PKD domain-containing protein [Bacteroidetes bacterium]|nr:PKD domain-containing protein [Bacteroidota bacterium]